MMDILLYCCVALLGGYAAYKYTNHVQLAWIVSAAGSIVAVIFFYVALWLSASSYEIISGTVTDKEVVYDPTTESYSCGTDSKGNSKTCTRTVPRWRFDVEADVGSWYDYSYSRWNVPSIYENAKIGEPFAKEKMFMNYQYVNDETVLVNKLDAYEGWLPEYPSVYEGYKVHRAFSNVVNVSELNAALAKAEQVWGKKFGVNVIVNVVPEKEAGFANALRNKWVGGKKNDVVLTLYVNAEHRVTKANVFSRSTSTKRTDTFADFNTTLRENAQRIDTLATQKIIGVIDAALPLFEREDLAEHDFGATSYSAAWYINALGIFVVLLTCFGTVKWLGGQRSFRRSSWAR
jgi:hypothetical protein